MLGRFGAKKDAHWRLATGRDTPSNAEQDDFWLRSRRWSEAPIGLVNIATQIFRSALDGPPDRHLIPCMTVLLAPHDSRRKPLQQCSAGLAYVILPLREKISDRRHGTVHIIQGATLYAIAIAQAGDEATGTEFAMQSPKVSGRLHQPPINQPVDCPRKWGSRRHGTVVSPVAAPQPVLEP